MSIVGTERHVNINGYVRKVEVLSTGYKDAMGYVSFSCCLIDGVKNDRTVNVPMHLFYHRDDGDMLVLRDSVEFLRKYPTHPVEIEKLPPQQIGHS